MNKISKGLITTLLAFFCGTFVSNSEEIKGAFGIELGQALNPDDPNSKLKEISPEHYLFQPVNPIKSLTIYSLNITPITKKVMAIYAMGEKIEKSKCMDDRNVLISILTSKYGNPTKPSFSDQMSDAVTYTKNTGVIRIECDGFTEANLLLSYGDLILTGLAEEERIEIETKKTNADGL